MDGRTPGYGPARLVCHCLLIETEQGLVLVDTGFGRRDVERPHPRTPASNTTLLNVQWRDQDTALHQVVARGFSPRDVRHIVLTHLDFDHAGGIEDFPRATVHLHEIEADAATVRNTVLAKMRYRPMQWDGMARWRGYRPQGERWFGFETVRQLDGLPPELLMVPLAGHSEGHCGVAVQRDDGRWLLHAGDAYFHEGEMASGAYCPPGLRLYERLMQADGTQRLANQARLRELIRSHADELDLFCSHDAAEFDRRVAGEQSAITEPMQRPSVESAWTISKSPSTAPTPLQP
jgi:glyoxylase-like metal-dependent hydrolase (beta-lactamase superfamily II)